MCVAGKKGVIHRLTDHAERFTAEKTTVRRNTKTVAKLAPTAPRLADNRRQLGEIGGHADDGPGNQQADTTAGHELGEQPAL